MNTETEKKPAVAPSDLTDELAVSRAEFEKKFTVPDGVVFEAWSYGAGYVCDKSKHVPGSIPMAEEFNRYWIGWISAWRMLTANARSEARPACGTSRSTEELDG